MQASSLPFYERRAPSCQVTLAPPYVSRLRSSSLISSAGTNSQLVHSSPCRLRSGDQSQLLLLNESRRALPSSRPPYASLHTASLLVLSVVSS